MIQPIKEVLFRIRFVPRIVIALQIRSILIDWEGISARTVESDVRNSVVHQVFNLPCVSSPPVFGSQMDIVSLQAH